MKLKSISLLGFKSFAERTTFLCGSGITGIIGPNGSGKSNLVDALRWVFGEQFVKNLRAQDASDIIFAGSQNRKPQSMAEVILHFQSDTFSAEEVSVGRRIYRDGEREYLMNGEPCRLKDIVDFLASLGLSARNYFIVEQEKRDRLIQADPQGMREIIEEVAQISVFKNKRKESEKSFQSVKQNLDIIETMNKELFQQRDKLQEESLKVTQKNQLQKQIKDLKYEYFFLKKQGLDHELEALSKLIGSKEQEFKNQEQVFKNLEEDVTTCRKNIKDLKTRKDSEEKLLQQKRGEVSKTQENIKDLQHKKEITEVQIQESLKEQNQLKEKITTSTHKDYPVTLRQIVETKIKTQELDEEKQSLEEDLKLQQKIIEDNKTDQITWETSLKNQTKEFQNLKNQQIMFEYQKQKNKDDEVRRTNLLNDLQIQYENHCKEEEDFQKKHTTSAETHGHILENKSKTDKKLEEVLSEFQDINQLEQNYLLNVQKNQGALSVLEKGQKKHHLDKLKKLAQDNQDKILGFVFDHCDYKDQELEFLMSGLCLKHYHDFAWLQESLKALEIQEFFVIIISQVSPLSSTELKKLESLKKEDINQSSIHFLDTHIQNIHPSLLPLFQRMIFSKETQNLGELLRKAPFLTGMSPEGVFPAPWFVQNQGSGGIYKTHQNIKDLQKENTLFKDKITELQKQKKDIKNHIDFLQKESRQWDQALYSHEKENAVLKASLERLRFQKQTIFLDLGKVQKQIQEFQKESTEIDAKNKIIIEKSDLLNQEINQIQWNLDHWKQKFQSHVDKIEVTKTSLNTFKNQLSLLKERLFHLDKSLDSIFKTLKEDQNKFLQVQDKHRNMQDIIKNLDSEKEDKNQKLTIATNVLNELLETFHKTLKEEENLQNKFEEIQKQLETFQSTKQHYDTYQQKNLLSKERLLTLYEGLKESLPEDFADFWKDREAPELTLEDIEKSLKETEKNLEIYGKVNEKAQEEFLEITTKIDFYDKQKKDVEFSLAQIAQSLHQIEESTRSKFREAFQSVNHEFQKLFPVLFPGGQGELRLQNPLDLLSTGVEIWVQLPGKRTQNLNLLSGGEKALIALSLIFAILRSAPVPFCFMDEVDAPLDEANVQRFCDLLQRLKNEFQFILISHNRKTMEVFDRIYGVSMVDPGISGILSVDMTQFHGIIPPLEARI